MNQKQFLIKGTFLLTAAGILSRLLGFFYRIFLSRSIGAEGIGIYHLILPVFMFCTALASGGIQTAVSRFCAEYYVKKEQKNADRILAAGLAISVSLAILTSLAVYGCADTISVFFLAEPRCAPLLRIAAFSLPFAVIHSCFCGYFVGMKQVKIPAAAQLGEQLIRIAAVLFLYYIMQKNGRPLTVTAMALGQVAGELASALLCTFCYLGQKPEGMDESRRSGNETDASSEKYPSRNISSITSECRKILSVSAPLGLNRMLVCVLQGIEAALLPQQLVRSGITSSEALSIYGTLNGMALPLLLFPTAITGSLGVLLLPAVSEARVLDNKRQLSRTIEGSFYVSFLLGVFCFGIFALFGTGIGLMLFDSRMAGRFIATLAWLCPFIYLNTTLVNILHGLGRTFAVSLQNTLGFLGRLAAVILLVPGHGIQGYFLGVFVSQILVFAAALYTLHHSSPLHLPLTDVFLKPLAACVLGICCFRLFYSLIPLLRQNSRSALILGGIIFTVSFLTAGYVLLPKSIKINAFQRSPLQ